MRLGIHKAAEAKSITVDIARAEDALSEEGTPGGSASTIKDRRRDDRPYLPNLARILYQP